MRYQFLIDTYATERLKTLSVWAMFLDEHLAIRPRRDDRRGRSVHEQLVHQCVSENAWFVNMLGVDVGAPPLPDVESRVAFIHRYATDSGKRLSALASYDDQWWEADVAFFEVSRSRAWVVTRRVAHSAHHRGQLTTMLRMLGRSVYSTYGPTADTGGLMQDKAPVIYPYDDVDGLVSGEEGGGAKRPLPDLGLHALTERPEPGR